MTQGLSAGPSSQSAGRTDSTGASADATCGAWTADGTGVGGTRLAPCSGPTHGGGGGSVFFGTGRKGSIILGNPGAAPVESRRMMCGVIITTSSLCSFFAALLRNNSPSTGMSPIPGTF